jgi:tetratricopeptide (TPR) repeat protein
MRAKRTERSNAWRRSHPKRPTIVSSIAWRCLRGVAHYHADDPAAAADALALLLERLPAGSIERREAVPHLEATRTWAPANLELAYAVAQAYLQLQRSDAARAVLAAIYGVETDSAAAHLITAQTMVRLEMEALAEPELTRALEKDPRLPAAHFLLGQVALFRGRFDEAVALTTRELEINPGNSMALSQLGDAYVRQAKWDEAIAALQKSIWLNPYYSAPYIVLWRAYATKGDPAAAEGMFRRAIQYDPNNRAAHYLLGQLLQQMGRTDEAARALETAERLSGVRGR